MQNSKLKIDIDERTYKFALNIVKFVQKLPKNIITFELGKQLLRSGTSIASNIEEAQGAFSKDYFIYKINTSLKEAKETHLWLKLIRDAKLVNDANSIEGLIEECHQIKNILGRIVKTSKGV